MERGQRVTFECTKLREAGFEKKKKKRTDWSEATSADIIFRFGATPLRRLLRSGGMVERHD